MTSSASERMASIAWLDSGSTCRTSSWRLHGLPHPPIELFVDFGPEGWQGLSAGAGKGGSGDRAEPHVGQPGDGDEDVDDGGNDDEGDEEHSFCDQLDCDEGFDGEDIDSDEEEEGLTYYYVDADDDEEGGEERADMVYDGEDSEDFTDFEIDDEEEQEEDEEEADDEEDEDEDLDDSEGSLRDFIVDDSDGEWEQSYGSNSSTSMSSDSKGFESSILTPSSCSDSESCGPSVVVNARAVSSSARLIDNGGQSDRRSDGESVVPDLVNAGVAVGSSQIRIAGTDSTPGHLVCRLDDIPADYTAWLLRMPHDDHAERMKCYGLWHILNQVAAQSQPQAVESHLIEHGQRGLPSVLLAPIALHQELQWSRKFPEASIGRQHPLGVVVAMKSGASPAPSALEVESGSKKRRLDDDESEVSEEVQRLTKVQKLV